MRLNQANQLVNSSIRRLKVKLSTSHYNQKRLWSKWTCERRSVRQKHQSRRRKKSNWVNRRRKSIVNGNSISFYHSKKNWAKNCHSRLYRLVYASLSYYRSLAEGMSYTSWCRFYAIVQEHTAWRIAVASLNSLSLRMHSLRKVYGTSVSSKMSHGDYFNHFQHFK